MKLGQSNNTSDPTDDSFSIALAAIEWLIRLLDTDFDPEEPYPDPLQRQKAFLGWLSQNPAHVRAFPGILEVERRRRASRCTTPDQNRGVDTCDGRPSFKSHSLSSAYMDRGLMEGSHASPHGHRASTQRLRPRSPVPLTGIAIALAATVVGFVLFPPRPVTGHFGLLLHRRRRTPDGLAWTMDQP